MTSTPTADAPSPSPPGEAPDLSLRDFARRLQQADVLDAPSAPGIDLSVVRASVQADQAAAAAAARASAMPWDGAAPAAPVLDGAGSSAEPDAVGGVAPRSGQLRSGLRWAAEDVVDVEPVAVAAPALDLDLDVDLDGGATDADTATLRRAGEAARRWQREQSDRAVGDWQPDLRAIGLRATVDPRVCAAWRPGVWIGVARTVIEASTELLNTPQGPLVDARPARRLLALWAPPDPAGPRPTRWPRQLWLQTEDGRGAADQLLAALPPTAELWLDEADADLDWALLAEIALHHEAELRPAERDALRALIAAERDRTWARLNDDYVRAAPGAPVRRRRGEPD